MVKSLRGRFFSILLRLGQNPITWWPNLANRRRFRKERLDFELLGGVVAKNYQILYEYDADAGVANGHYFHQDLEVASAIFEAKPSRHIDIGSSVYGFVSHVASFRKIDVVDIRPLPDSGHQNITFVQMDFMNPTNVDSLKADSVSCLHAIEHFGLGRYGDEIDPEGHRKGFANLMEIVNPGGVLYISFPIGISNEVHFNAHRVFHPHDIFSWSDELDLWGLEKFHYVDDAGTLHRNVDLVSNPPKTDYGCGIYTFRKPRESK